MGNGKNTPSAFVAKNPHAPDAMQSQRSSTSSPPNSPNNPLGLGSIPNKIFDIHAAAMSLQVLRRTSVCVLVYTGGLDAAADVSWWPLMINEKLPPSFVQGGHPTLRQLAARSAQPVNWSGRLLLIAPPLGTIRVHVQRISSLFSAFTPSWLSYDRAGPGITPVEAVLRLEKLSEEARKIPFGARDELRARLDVRLGVVARQVVGACCGLFSKYHP
ncbi:hypothetical protein INS49_001469 [Diaporthe citri]|uniref:uncharacterized protein n=1 Tax=Diaporthe citri TaxID=83186 RepID=UPI001C8253D9|nr:uncharacterized protein INS49_001469 [Diaporthe citri]KAG6367282.1 hypothetical protein INS49_001469 [Diaporthe citri]